MFPPMLSLVAIGSCRMGDRLLVLHSLSLLTHSAAFVLVQGGKADAAVKCGCVPLLTRALRESMDHDHEVAHATLLSLGRLLQRTTVPRLQVMPQVRM